MTSIGKLALAALGLSFAIAAGNARAATFAEVGEAGELRGTAQSVGAGFNAISGSIGTVGDADAFRIFLPGGFFSASTVGGTAADFDTQLFLFGANGIGIVANDNSGGTLQSTIEATVSAGLYYLVISPFGRDPVDGVGNPTFASEISTSEQWQAFAIANGYTPPTGTYVITFNVETIPEPATMGLLGTGLLGLLAGRRRAGPGRRR